jgi:hypothetical protein
MGEPGVVDRHEDWGFFSFDPERGAIIFRQFHSEGYVNVYVLEDPDAPGDTWVFKSERTEGAQGMRARLRWKVHPPNEYEVILELAPVGEGFKPCQQVHMRRREAPS